MSVDRFEIDMLAVVVVDSLGVFILRFVVLVPVVSVVVLVVLLSLVVALSCSDLDLVFIGIFPVSWTQSGSRRTNCCDG